MHFTRFPEDRKCHTLYVDLLFELQKVGRSGWIKVLVGVSAVVLFQSLEVPV